MFPGPPLFNVNVGTLLVCTAGNGSNPSAYNSRLSLGTNNNITSSTAIVVGDSGGIVITSPSQQKVTVTTAPAGNTTILAPGLVLGGRKFNAIFTLGSGSALNLGSSGNRSSLGVAHAGLFAQSGTSSSFSGNCDLSGGTFTGYLTSLAVGTISNNGTGNETSTMTLGASAANHLDISGPGSVVLVGTNFGINTRRRDGNAEHRQSGQHKRHHLH